MGYSCRVDAMAGFEALMSELERQFPVYHKGEVVQWSWTFGGKSCFAEIGRENVDGAITGQVYAYLPDGKRARSCGSFRVEGDGRITRFPKVPRAALRAFAQV